jgi:hypothetical protein
MQIRYDQMKALLSASRARFNRTAAVYLRTQHAGHPVIQNDSSVAEFVDQGVKQAAKFGITREVDVIRFLEVLLAIGEDFESSVCYIWVADYLREDMRAEARLDAVIMRLHFGIG